MAKDKKKDGKAKKDKKTGKSGGKGLLAQARNPLVAEVVAAALVATAAALKDSKRARALADDAAEELRKLSKVGPERGSALWDMALQIGRRSLEAFAAPESARSADAKVGSKAKSTTKAKAGSKKGGNKKKKPPTAAAAG